MPNEALQSALSQLNPSLLWEADREWPTAVVEADQWPALALQLRHEPLFSFDFLFCLTCVDWKTHLAMVYHLRSTRHRHDLVIKSTLNRDQPLIASVCSIWKTAEFHEREVYELFGVQFRDHPDLRKLILPDDWVGFPLRKDYTDEINMIKL